MIQKGCLECSRGCIAVLLEQGVGWVMAPPVHLRKWGGGIVYPFPPHTFQGRVVLYYKIIQCIADLSEKMANLYRSTSQIKATSPTFFLLLTLLPRGFVVALYRPTIIVCATGKRSPQGREQCRDAVVYFTPSKHVYMIPFYIYCVCVFLLGDRSRLLKY